MAEYSNWFYRNINRAFYIVDEEESIEVLQDDFQRQTVPNEILVENYITGDVTAPGRITDVSIIDISTERTQFGESRNFTITWTATGDDVNTGQGFCLSFHIYDALYLNLNTLFIELYLYNDIVIVHD